MSGGSQWEYKVVQWVGSIWGTGGEWDTEAYKDFSSEQVLNELGAKGWELISLGPVHNEVGKAAVAYIFKRLRA